ncbi:unnamed protein product [Amoebophrya sp. A25]|nr:unnamed protein product [Amoebophrya sp. A25]|eukprot:GSA25T00012138001.1
MEFARSLQFSLTGLRRSCRPLLRFILGSIVLGDHACPRPVFGLCVTLRRAQNSPDAGAGPPEYLSSSPGGHRHRSMATSSNPRRSGGAVGADSTSSRGATSSRAAGEESTTSSSSRAKNPALAAQIARWEHSSVTGSSLRPPPAAVDDMTVMKAPPRSSVDVTSASRSVGENSSRDAGQKYFYIGSTSTSPEPEEGCGGAGELEDRAAARKYERAEEDDSLNKADYLLTGSKRGRHANKGAVREVGGKTKRAVADYHMHMDEPYPHDHSSTSCGKSWMLCRDLPRGVKRAIWISSGVAAAYLSTALGSSSGPHGDNIPPMVALAASRGLAGCDLSVAGCGTRTTTAPSAPLRELLATFPFNEDVENGDEKEN